MVSDNELNSIRGFYESICMISSWNCRSGRYIFRNFTFYDQMRNFEQKRVDLLEKSCPMLFSVIWCNSAGKSTFRTRQSLPCLTHLGLQQQEFVYTDVFFKMANRESTSFSGLSVLRNFSASIQLLVGFIFIWRLTILSFRTTNENETCELLWKRRTAMLREICFVFSRKVTVSTCFLK